MSAATSLLKPEVLDDVHGRSTAEQRRDASRLVLKHARNRDDLRLLLNALGLNTTPQGDAA